MPLIGDDELRAAVEALPKPVTILALHAAVVRRASDRVAETVFEQLDGHQFASGGVFKGLPPEILANDFVMTKAQLDKLKGRFEATEFWQDGSSEPPTPLPSSS